MKKIKDDTSVVLDLYFQTLERNIISMIDLNLLDEAICKIEKGLAIIQKRNIDFGIQKRRFAMLYTNLGIAFESKYEDEEDRDKKEEYYKKAKKHLKRGLKLWREMEDIYNSSVSKLHLADLSLSCDYNVVSWFNRYRRICREVKGINTNTYQRLYAEILLRMVNQYCSSDVFAECGMTYKGAKRYLTKVNEIYNQYCADDVISKLGYSKTCIALELTYSDNIFSCQKIIREIEKLLHKYQEHTTQDSNKNFELYVNDIQNNLGTAYYRLGCGYISKNQKKAVLCFSKSIEYFQAAIRSYMVINAQGSELLFKVYINIANTRLMLFKCDKNKNYLKDNIKLLRVAVKKLKELMPKNLIIVEAYISLGKSFGFLGNFKQEIKFYNEAEKCINENGDGVETGQLRYWLYKGYANSYKNQEKRVEAKEYFSKTKNILLDKGYTIDSAEIMEIDQELEELKGSI